MDSGVLNILAEDSSGSIVKAKRLEEGGAVEKE
jgi:hypothetical protein